MIKDKSQQVDWLSPQEESTSAMTARSNDDETVMLGLELDSREWLSFLAEEWWPLKPGAADVRLGVGSVVEMTGAESRIKVVAWVDPSRLPDCQVPVFRNGAWGKESIHHVGLTDSQIVWPGVLPLSAVASFTANSENESARLTAMAKGFQNVELGDRSVEVRKVSRVTPNGAPPETTTRFRPPRGWDSLRGAAAMAAWAVPSIDPWLDVFCESVSNQKGKRNAAAGLGAAWLSKPIWDRRQGNGSVALWTAILDIFGKVKYREDWRPQELLDSIIALAVQLGADAEAMDTLAKRTRKIILDEAVVDPLLADQNPLGLALQLVLLRPKPETFVEWIDSVPSMPPAVWWTGAMLCGYITGFRDLETQFRGLPLSREMLAVRTWTLAYEKAGGSLPWPDNFSSVPEWNLADDRVQITDAGRVWAERKSSRRGEWFRADYSEPQVHQQAFELARRFAPSAVRKCLRLNDTILQSTGDGKLSLDRAGKRLTVKGQVELILSDDIAIVEDLDVDCFRDWLAVGSVAERLPVIVKQLPARPVEKSAIGKPSSDRPTSDKTASEPPTTSKEIGHQLAPLSFDMPAGLFLLPEFISEEEEASLLREVDASPWRQDLVRRVQHYGWRYDYTSRRIDQSAYLGPLPVWAQTIATRLVEAGLVPETPDQLIVNEYVGNQGITRHVDCLDCFSGPVVTVSLGESWGMLFRSIADERKVEHVLNRRSAAILSGEARNKWHHEIPKRKKEGKELRGRRVSLTFRKVLLSLAGAQSARSRDRKR